MSGDLPKTGSTIEPIKNHVEEHVGNKVHQTDSIQNENDLRSSTTLDTSRPTSSSASVTPPRGHGALERIPTTSETQDDINQERMQVIQTVSTAPAPVHSVFTVNQKRFIVFMAGWAGFFSTVSANIYFPALNPLANDLHVSNGLINLTLTSYMIFQGLAPAFIGDLADSMGRRVAYATCFIIYISANVGLALQNSYVALFILRCMQSAGSSATIAMASGVVSDIATASERGSYMGFTMAGALVGPAIGPVIGGILAEYTGWRGIFWFLVIAASLFLIIFAIFFPETARKQVGNGSIPPRGWSMSLMNYLAVRKARRQAKEEGRPTEMDPSQLPAKTKMRFPNPLSSLYVVLDKENALLLFYNSFLFAAFYDVTAAIPSQFAPIFKFSDLQIGLCYIPFGIGSMTAAFVNGLVVDRNFARWCRKLGIKIQKGRNQDLRSFPIEKARLEVALPSAYAVCASILLFGWLLDAAGKRDSDSNHGYLAGILVSLFCNSFSMGMAFNVTSTLLVDFYPKRPATATAANNLTRCGVGAITTAVLIPMLDGMGRGWTYTFLALFLIACSPMLWLLYFYGMEWREQRRVREEAKERKQEEAKAGTLEDGRNKNKKTRKEAEKSTNTNEESSSGSVLESVQDEKGNTERQKNNTRRETTPTDFDKFMQDQQQSSSKDSRSGNQGGEYSQSHHIHLLHRTATHESGF